MVCEEFVKPKRGLNKKSIKLLEKVKEITEDYWINKGLSLSERQIHYQLVGKNIYENSQKSYDALTRLVTNARMYGLIDWDMIVDRNRETRMPYYQDSIKAAIDRTLLCYRRDRMLIQDVYIEVMIEKMAIFEIIEQVTDKYSIMLTGDKGFCSTTILYDIAKRMRAAKERGKKCYILYIGDHDPSGLTMDESIKSTISLMKANGVGFERVALTKEQIEKYNLPPNKVKDGDKNSTKYKEDHGETSWECDALLPEILQELLEDKIRSIINIDNYEYMLRREEEDREKLKQMIESIKTN